MSALQQALLMANGAPQLTLPYTLDFNGFADRAGMLAAYSALGFTFTSMPLGAPGDPGTSSLLDIYGVLGGGVGIPNFPADGITFTPYLFVNAFGGSFPFDFTITFPTGLPVQQITKDIWRYGSAPTNMRITYEDASTDSEGTLPPGGPSAGFSTSDPFPAAPPGPNIVSMTIRVASGGAKWAIDNIILS